MSDVRDELFHAIEFEICNVNTSWPVVDRILERFDVTPKPAVREIDLGQMVGLAAGGYTGGTEEVGRKMLDQLDAACLRIVRCDDNGA